MSNELTPKQQEVLIAIMQLLNHNIPCTLQNLAEHLMYTQPSSVQAITEVLRRNDWIIYPPRQHGITGVNKSKISMWLQGQRNNLNYIELLTKQAI